jgi:D-sedoheptulose 7-phosphate isomerase
MDEAQTSGTQALILASIRETARNLEALETMAPLIERIAERLIGVLKNGGKVMFCGNGGSAADSQHLAAELEGRFLIDRRPLAAIALTTNTSTLTAIGNDFGFDSVFERQVCGLGTAKDALVGISTSGNSSNVLRALQAARESGILTVGFSGQGGGQMTPLCDFCLCVPSLSTPRIQEMHILAGHIICDIVERALA